MIVTFSWPIVVGGQTVDWQETELDVLAVPREGEIVWLHEDDLRLVRDVVHYFEAEHGHEIKVTLSPTVDEDEGHWKQSGRESAARFYAELRANGGIRTLRGLTSAWDEEFREAVSALAAADGFVAQFAPMHDMEKGAVTTEVWLVPGEEAEQ